MVSSILRTDKLCKTFSNGGRQQHVIKNMDLEIMENDFTIIMGAYRDHSFYQIPQIQHRLLTA